MPTTPSFVGIASLALLACSSPSTAPALGPGIHFVAGNNQTDTVQATLDQALVVRLGSPPAGQSLAHHVVQFVSIPPADSVDGMAYVQSLTASTATTFVSDTVSASGQASVIIVMGTTAGRARVMVKVPDFGWVDTAYVTVAPGAAASILAGPSDTAIYVGGTATLHSTAVDRFGNTRPEVVSYTLLSGPATLATSTVTSTAIGRVLVAGTAAGIVDTSYISCVPTGTIAAALDAGGIVTFNLDGSNFTQRSTLSTGNVRWSPSGSALVFDHTNAGGHTGGDGGFESLTLPSVLAQLDSSPGVIDAWPIYSHDGSWIYYAKVAQQWTLWRVRPNGTGDSAVAVQNAPYVQFMTPSPDGTQLSYFVPEGGTLHVLTLATGNSSDLGIPGNSAVWSPISNVIAYTNTSLNMVLVSSDGSGQRVLSNGSYAFTFDWSPNGQWIIARDNSTGKLVLVSTTSNMILPLGFTGNLGSPAWRP